eukprot:1158740-Pelagomonas_calceolata.AAC.1
MAQTACFMGGEGGVTGGVEALLSGILKRKVWNTWCIYTALDNPTHAYWPALLAAAFTSIPTFVIAAQIMARLRQQQRQSGSKAAGSVSGTQTQHLQPDC